MSQNTINGFSDILSKNNLTTNGSFVINQRSNFTSLTSCVANDYVADCWKATVATIDYCQVQNATNAYKLLISGTGKKGQSIAITSKDTQKIGRTDLYGTSDPRSVITACAVAYNAGGVPFKLNLHPRLYSMAYDYLYDYQPIIKSGEAKQAVNITKTRLHNVDQGAAFVITLLADGAFSVWIENFGEFMGAYKNPPDFAIVPFAEELLRCERYYQVLSARRQMPMWAASAGPNLIYGLVFGVEFRSEMVGTPSISTTISSMDLYQIADSTAFTAVDAANWGATPTASSKGINYQMVRTPAVAINRQVAIVTLDIIASI